MKNGYLGALPVPSAASVFFAIVALLVVSTVQAQEGFGRSPTFRVLGMEDGLSQSSINAMVQDREGYLWLGTQDGLNRYDGNRFAVFRHQADDSGSLPDDFILALYEDSQGNLWVGTERGGLARLSPGASHFDRFPLQELDEEGSTIGSRSGSRRSTVFAISEGFGAELLLGTDKGLVVLDRSTGLAQPVRGSPIGPINAILRTKDTLWAGGSGGELVRYTRALERLWEPDGSMALGSPITALQTGPEGRLWIGTETRGVLLVESGPSWEDTPPFELSIPTEKAPIRDIFVDGDSLVWIATSNGATAVRFPSKLSVSFDFDPAQERGLPDQDVTRILRDRSGILWLGTWGGLASTPRFSEGIDVFPVGGAPSSGLSHGVVAILPDGRGDVWLGTLGAGIDRLNLNSRSVEAIGHHPTDPTKPGAELIFGFAPSSSGFWIATYGSGVNWSDWEAQKFTRIPLGLNAAGTPERNATSVLEDASGRVYAGSRSAGLLRYDPTQGRFKPADGPHGTWELGSDYVWPIIEARDSSLWVGAFEGGLSRISRDRLSHDRWTSDHGLSDDRILTLLEDLGGVIWIGTQGGGLNRFDPTTQEFRVYTVGDGLPHDHVEGILEDDSGLLWISTNNGLARFDPRSEEFWVFRENSGLAGNRFFANSAYKDDDGLLYFGGPNGLTVVDPSKIEKRNEPPPVALTGFQIHGREALVSRALAEGGLDLQPDENFFTFSFAALDFTDVSQNRYRYRLEPLDDGWIDIGNDNVANYTSVPAGRYTFRVAARNSENVWNEEGLAIPVRVRAPYYQTWPFQLAMAALVLLAVSGIYGYRMNEIHRRQALRLGIAGKLHDDIGADLSAIALKSEMVRRGSDLDERRKKMLADVGRLARDTALKVRETVWVVNTQYDTVAGLVSKMRDTADMILEGQASFTFDAPESVPAKPISMEQRQDVYLLFKEVLHNLVKHAHARRVEILLTYDAPHFSFRVSDDGVGFAPADPELGNGLLLMRQRAAKHRGQLTVESKPAGGTAVELRVRLK